MSVAEERLFARVPVAGVSWLRITSAAVVFAAWRRPWTAFFSAQRDFQYIMLALTGRRTMHNITASPFTLYIILAHRLSRTEVAANPIDPLGASMIIAALTITPLGLVDAAGALRSPALLAAGLGVGVSSSVVPYVFDQLAMAQLPRASYALFVALLPATAVAIGVIVLRQVPQALEAIAVGLVIADIAIHRPNREEAP